MAEQAPYVENTKDRRYQQMLLKVLENPKRFSNWQLDKGGLFKYVGPIYDGSDKAEDCWKKAVAKERGKQIISQYHDLPTAGHLGTCKTYARLMERFFWPKMRYNVIRNIKKCKICS